MNTKKEKKPFLGPFLQNYLNDKSLKTHVVINSSAHKESIIVFAR